MFLPPVVCYRLTDCGEYAPTRLDDVIAHILKTDRTKATQTKADVMSVFSHLLTAEYPKPKKCLDYFDEKDDELSNSMRLILSGLADRRFMSREQRRNIFTLCAAKIFFERIFDKDSKDELTLTDCVNIVNI